MTEPLAARPGDLLLVLAYRGTRFHGYERQAKGEATVRGTLEEALSELAGRPVATVAAGRTDRGVHAAALPVLARGPFALPPERVPPALNARLPEDLAVVLARTAPPGFHPRRDAISKTYVYNIWTADHPSPFWRPFAWLRPGPLDREALARACAALSGTHDFRAFGRAGRPVWGAVRRVELAVSARGPLVTLWAESRGFLYKMVRSLVGTLVEVARGALTLEALGEIVRGARPAGPTAPPEGLTLVSVRYPFAEFRGEDFVDLLPPRP
ncbi:MAG: tRNA pseudouridine(38-40) synthase TruA [Clostridia bacterium]|nr:tRNA pseudouridine(38-40) synthase TruA [Clostridia bacterium]